MTGRTTPRTEDGGKPKGGKESTQFLNIESRERVDGEFPVVERSFVVLLLLYRKMVFPERTQEVIVDSGRAPEGERTQLTGKRVGGLRDGGGFKLIYVTLRPPRCLRSSRPRNAVGLVLLTLRPPRLSRPHSVLWVSSCRTTLPVTHPPQVRGLGWRTTENRELSDGDGVPGRDVDLGFRDGGQKSRGPPE